jgi:hypothetical protein
MGQRVHRVLGMGSHRSAGCSGPALFLLLLLLLLPSALHSALARCFGGGSASCRPNTARLEGGKYGQSGLMARTVVQVQDCPGWLTDPARTSCQEVRSLWGLPGTVGNHLGVGTKWDPALKRG